MPRPARWAPLAIVATLSLGPSVSAVAVPTLDLSWETCTPIVSTRSPMPGQPIATLYCSATGMDRVHIGYVAKLWFATEMPCRTATSTPDAWRFDNSGCQAGLAQIAFTDTLGVCPPLSGPPPVLTIAKFEYSPVDVYDMTAEGSMRVIVAAAYPGAPQTPDPAQRYHVFAIRFDHSYSVAGEGEPGVTCGGYDRPLCFALWSGVETNSGYCAWTRGPTSVYVDQATGLEFPFQLGQGFATFGLDAGSRFSCFEVLPARAATWGAIKAQHR